jgi:hypothetical protein
MKKISLQDLYKFTKTSDGFYMITEEEFTRFEQNFQDYLEMRHALKHNKFIEDQYEKLYVYSKWFNEL